MKSANLNFKLLILWLPLGWVGPMKCESECRNLMTLVKNWICLMKKTAWWDDLRKKGYASLKMLAGIKRRKNPWICDSDFQRWWKQKNFWCYRFLDDVLKRLMIHFSGEAAKLVDQDVLNRKKQDRCWCLGDVDKKMNHARCPLFCIIPKSIIFIRRQVDIMTESGNLRLMIMYARC